MYTNLIRLSILALKPRGDAARSPKGGISGLTKIIYLLQKIFLKKIFPSKFSSARNLLLNFVLSLLLATNKLFHLETQFQLSEAMINQEDGNLRLLCICVGRTKEKNRKWKTRWLSNFVTYRVASWPLLFFFSCFSFFTYFNPVSSRCSLIDVIIEKMEHLKTFNWFKHTNNGKLNLEFKFNVQSKKSARD